jgi:nucleotide-binding universal stress UspA family protein
MSKPLQTVVIGTPLIQESDGIVRTGVAVARATGASPWLVHAYTPPAYATELVDARWLEWQEESVRAGLAQQAKRTGLADLAACKPDQLLPSIGSPAREIVALARQVRADLIVIGATEGGPMHRAFLGSTADGVIRKASCPVLVVRSEAAFPPVRVEIPVDLSPVSASAFRQGLELLRQLGVPLTETEALFVLNPIEVSGLLQFSPQQIERFADEELHRFVAANSPGPRPRRTLIRTGYAREEILAVLAERQADLAILGTHGRGGFERLTVGSVAAEIMHQSRCNLLVVPPDASLRREVATTDETEGEQRTGADWDFVSDEIPAAVG